MSITSGIGGLGVATPKRELKVRLDESDGGIVRGRAFAESSATLYDIEITYNALDADDLKDVTEDLDENIGLDNGSITTATFSDGHTYLFYGRKEYTFTEINSTHAKLVVRGIGTRV